MSTDIIHGIFKCLTNNEYNIVKNKTEVSESSLDEIFKKIYKQNEVKLFDIVNVIEKYGVHKEAVTSMQSNNDKIGLKLNVQLNLDITTRTVVISVLPNDTIESIMQQICDMTGKQVSDMRVFFAGHQCDNSKTVSDCGLSDGSSIFIHSRCRGGADSDFNIFIRTLNNNLFPIATFPECDIKRLKSELEKKLNIPYFQIELIFNNKQLTDKAKLSELNIAANSTIHLIRNIDNKLKILENDIFDPFYDYDFTNIDDKGISFVRGGEAYYRPCGWKRSALKVRGKYENDVWLGSTNQKGEWPVAYHGTNFDGLKGICFEGFDLKKLKRFMFGKGHYTTPLIEIAEHFAAETVINGKKIKFILQCRVHPLKVIKAYSDKYWILPNDHGIRPYGICYKICS